MGKEFILKNEQNSMSKKHSEVLKPRIFLLGYFSRTTKIYLTTYSLTLHYKLPTNSDT